ncbi:unnamed protein product [Rotaria sp. Silwood2]|nr:unnamed protein product [Rotaria sp. Silwood2]CAF2734375.1 unnamed protein product [Rotaria sp. Silwood2]CAF3133188.1 unnamed protein product [Rotaria sp. Silwood2]CAF4106368.1 unnamed protein product [Rotaria sp. Silwood2]CAF4239615.1 unnamed protein product [Rotaria sp. Silwood2]
MNQRQTNNTLEDIRQSIENNFGANTIYSKPDKNGHSLVTDQSLSENDFDNCIINEIHIVNNGHVFSEDNWKKVITIAEGNTNFDAIGQFGVGFFSIFSYSERPIIQSGNHCLVFV